jgi:hypothetical protein
MKEVSNRFRKAVVGKGVGHKSDDAGHSPRSVSKQNFLLANNVYKVWNELGGFLLSPLKKWWDSIKQLF